MVKIAGYLEQCRAGFEVAVEVPPSLCETAERNRLRKGLGTRNVRVACARLQWALMELHDLLRLWALSGMRIEEACRLTVAMCADTVFQVPGTKTNAARRAVPIHPDLAAMGADRSKGRVGAWKWTG